MIVLLYQFFYNFYIDNCKFLRPYNRCNLISLLILKLFNICIFNLLIEI